MLKRRKKYDYDLIVLGSGAGGSVGAHYAKSLGKKVAIIESDAIGGECPNFACVPTKALLHAAAVYDRAESASLYGIMIDRVKIDYQKVKEWKDLAVSRTGAAHGKESFQKEGIHVFHAKAHFISPHTIEAGGKIYSAAKFLLATGSKVFVPAIPGLEEAGFITSKQAVDLEKLPDSLLVYGGGAVGCELAHIFATFGVKVYLVNRSDRLLSKEDKEVSELVKALFENEGITVLTETEIDKIEKRGKKKGVFFKKGKEEFVHEVDEILLATGKIPNLDFEPEKAGIVAEKGKLRVNNHLQTNVPHIYAAGDIIGPYLYTHTGYYQSYIAAHNAFSRNKMIPDYRAIPRCVFLQPEIASVGISEIEAKKKGIPIKKGIVAIGILGRANTSNDLDGFVKVITDKKGVIIGASIVSHHAGEMIHEIALAMKLRVKASVLANMVHAYPTFSEAIKIACAMIQ